VAGLRGFLARERPPAGHCCLRSAARDPGRHADVAPRAQIRDYERLPQPSEAHLTWALITRMTRRLTRKGAP
jgi:hypothetical protein